MMTGDRTKELEDWLAAGARAGAAKGMLPGPWPAMVERHGAVEAMRRVLRTPVEQTPLGRLHKLGLLEWSIEAGVLRFPELFTAEDREIAQFRVDHPEL